MAEVLINGQRQGWGDCEFNVLNRTVTGIKKISIESKQEKSNEGGQGHDAVHRSRGMKSHKASIELYHYEVFAILRELGKGKDLTDCPPFTINIVFTPFGSDTLSRIDVPMTEFMDSGLNVDMSQGDKSIPIKLDLITGKPLFN